MDNWHSEWVVEGPDFDTSQNSPQFPAVQWSEGEEDITADSPHLSRYSNESAVDEKDKCEKIESPVKPSYKNVILAKKRLQAYTKQSNKLTSKDEKRDGEDKPEKLVGKKSKKALYPDEKAKMVIQEIEVIKKKEVEENLKKQQLFAEAFRSYTAVTLRPRSRSLSSESTKQFKRREIKSRNYRRTDSIGRKSVSPDDQTRRGGRRPSPSHKRSVYPKNWTEYKQRKLTVTKDETLKKKCFPSHSNSVLEFYNKMFSFCVPSPPIESFRCATEHGEKLVPTQFLRFTKSKPPIIFSTNFEAIKESYLSRKQLFQVIPKEREAIIKKLIDNPSKAQPSNKRNRSQQPWYHKSWKKSGEPECKILENSVGLSFLQNYSDEDEEYETEEIVICSSVRKKKKDQNETAATTNDKNRKTEEVVNFAEKSLSDDVEIQKLDSEVAALMENHQTSQIEHQNEGSLTPVELERDFKTPEKNQQDAEKNVNDDETIEFEERLTPIKFDLKLQIGKKNERDLEREAANEHETNIEMADTDRLTPQQVSYYNEMIDYSEDRLTPEEIPKYGKTGLDDFNITKSAIEELQKELKKRENIKEENRVKVKKKRKKTGVKRKMESSDMEEEELPKAKKRKKKNKQKKKVSEEEEDSMSSEDEKAKKKQKRGGKRKKEKSKKKKNKYKRDKTWEAKVKKKKAPSEEKTKKEKSKKKKTEASEDLTFSDEPKKKTKKKDKKKRQKKLSVSEDTSISKDKKIPKDISVQDPVQEIPEKKKHNDWEDEDLLSSTFQMLEKERSEKIDSSKSSHYELVEKLKDRKSEKLERGKKTGKEKERRRHSKDDYIDVMSELEAIKSVDESQILDLNRSREIDHSRKRGRSKDRKSARGKKYSEEHSDLEIEYSKKPSMSKEGHRKQKERKPKSIEEVRPPLFIKQEPGWEEKESFVKKQSKHEEDDLITSNLEDFPLTKDTLGVAEDLGTPDTDEYRGNWEKDPFPVWESEDESVPKVTEKINTSWESDEEVYERARVIDKPLDFTEGLDLEIPLNIKPFKRREVIDADKELQLLKIESQTLNEERIQLELEKIKVKQLELSVIKEVESKEKEPPSKRRKSLEETTKEVEDKAKRRRWDRREAEPSRKPSESIVVIDLSESTSSVNTSAVLENEYEEFIKAVTSKPCPEDARKLNDSVISLSSVSDFSDSNCSFDNAFGKKFIDVQPLKMSTPIKHDLPRISDSPVSQIIIAPKDIPFIPMPGEVKPMPGEGKPIPVPVPPITAIASPGILSLPAQILSSIVEVPGNNTPEQLKTDASTLEEIVELVVTPTLPETPAEYKEEVVTSSLQEDNLDVVEIKERENVVESTNDLTLTLDVSLEEKPSSSAGQNTPGKPFSFTSLVLPSKKLLIDNSKLNLDDSDDESTTRMKAIDEIRMENLFQWSKLEEPKEELKDLKQETKLETKQETKLETKQVTKLETKPETKLEAKQQTKQETKQETKRQESKEEVKQVLKGKEQEIRKSEDGEKSVKAGNRDRKLSRSRSPKSAGHHGRDKVERRAVSPKRSSDSSHSSRYRRRESSPRRRGRSPKKHCSAAQSPARRNSSPGLRRRYSSRRSTSPIHRRRSPSSRKKSPTKRPTSPKTSSSKSKNLRSKSPQKPESTVKPHQTSQPTEKPLVETNTQKPSAIIASPLEELKKSVADSTISDDSLLPQPNLDELAESPVSHFYGRPKPNISRQLSMNEGVRQILGYAKEDLRPISTTYNDNYGYDQNQLSQILKTIGQFSRSNANEAGSSSKSEPSQENLFRNISAAPVNIEVPITKAYKNVPTTQNSFVQVGNMVQIVPGDYNVKTENVRTVVSNRQAGHDNKLLQQEKKARIVQVGNMLQIVPNDSPPEPILPPPLPILPPLPPEPENKPMETLKVVAKVITEQEKQSAEMAMKQKVAEQREERERRRKEREARRKEKEKRRREKEKHRQVKMKQKTENMIKRALQLEVEGEEGASSLLNETPTQWPPLPSIAGSSKDGNKSILVLGHRKSVKLDRRKVVQFADGVRPGEGTSPSAGEELSSSPRYRKLPKEKRYTKTKMRMKDKKKKIKVKIIKPITDTEESDEDDRLPPPSPPPGSPPPHLFPPRVKTHPVNNIHPYVANLIPAAQSSQSPVLYRPSLNVLLPPLPPTHHHLPPPLPLSMPPHHLSRPPEPPMMHHGALQGMAQLHVPPPPPPLPPTGQTAGGTHRSLSYHY